MENPDSSRAMAPQPHLPPGFRFHPTDEELVVHYLKRKAAAIPLPVAIIADIDIYKFDPWELPEKAIFGEQEWYFFTPRERKYPNGARPNRAATSGYWKATGTDKPVLESGNKQKVGVKKALVFYGGKPPKGVKTNWIMHEYRLPENKASGHNFGNKKPSLRLDDWVLCRIYKKGSAQRPEDQENDEINDSTMLSSIPRGLSMPFGQHVFVSDHQNTLEGMTMFKTSGSRSIPQPDYFNPYLNEEHRDGNFAAKKRFLAENFVEKPDNMTVNLASTVVEGNEMMGGQDPSHGNNIGEGVFGQQFLGLNWY